MTKTLFFAHPPKMTGEALYYNALNLGTVGDREKILRIGKRFGNWRRSYEAFLRENTPRDIDADWQKLNKAGIRLVMRGDDSYPTYLNEITDAPFGIYIRGTFPERASKQTFAIVGTRRATPEGKNIARRFSRELAECGFVIVSGLALGIDAAAHEGCLDAKGLTVAVLAGGLDGVYPRENEGLAKRILASGGALMSEYPLGAPPYPARFLERNRIISGLSRGTLIVEAPTGSGSLRTAHCSMEENRDVFVVPGSITKNNFEGSHALIRQGAELVTRPEEILEVYGVTPEKKFIAAASGASIEERQVLEALRAEREPIDVDKIAAAAKLEAQIVNRALAFLIMKNLVREKSGGYTI